MSDVTISFEPPTLGGSVAVTNQYNSVGGLANGVNFGWDPPALPAGSQVPDTGYGVVATCPSPPGAPGTQVASLAGPGEFGDAAAFGMFNSPHQHVGILVGGIRSAAIPTLIAYDINGQIVATESANVAVNESVQLNAVSSNATPNIMFFVIQGADDGRILWFTDLTYDLVGSAAPDFLLRNVGAVLCQGSSVSQAAQLTRFGGSNGDISLIAGPPLPGGISVAFSPPAVGGTAESFDVLFSATADAPLEQAAEFSVSGTPASAAVGSQERFARGYVTVVAPFTLSVFGGYPPAIAIATCGPGLLQLQIMSNPGFPGGPVSVTCAGLPASVQCDIQPALVQLAAFPSSALVNVELGTAAQLAGNFPIEFTAKTGGFSQQLTITLTAYSTSIQTVSVQSGTTPQALRPGTAITIQGVGFCPGTKVRFGNDLAVVAPDSLTNDQIIVTLPRLATTGVAGAGAKTDAWPQYVPFGLVLPDGTTIPWALPPTVYEYRNTYGFPFYNYYFGGIDFDQLTELFGEDATHDDALGFVVRDPWAITFCALANAFLKLGGDICFGMTLSTQRLKNNEWGSVNVQDLPTSDLPGYAAFSYLNAGLTPPPPAPLSDFIHVQHVAQLSDEWMHYYLNAALGNGPSIKGYITSCLQNNDFPLVAIRQGLFTGHVLVAYDLEPNPQDPSGFIIDVYDPDEQFIAGTSGTPAEDSDSTGKKHRNALVLSQVTVAGDGSWSFPLNAHNSDTPTEQGGVWRYPPGDYWTGGADELVVGSTSIIPATPSMPGVLSALLVTFEAAAVALSSEKDIRESIETSSAPSSAIETVQLSDASGRTLFTSGRVLNRNPGTRVPAAPLVPLSGDSSPAEAFVVQQGLAYRHEVRGRSAGRYSVSLIGRPFTVSAASVTAVDQRDELIFDTGARSFTFKAGAAGVPLTAEVTVRGPDGSARIATLKTRSTAGATEIVRFNSDASALTFEHHGPPANYELRITAMNREGRRHSWVSGTRIAPDGHAATFTPVDWHDLSRIVLAESGTTTARLVGRIRNGGQGRM